MENSLFTQKFQIELLSENFSKYIDEKFDIHSVFEKNSIRIQQIS